MTQNTHPAHGNSRDIFKNAYLPYRDPETLRSFQQPDPTPSATTIPERLSDAFEYLLPVLGSQGDAGQFRTPRHLIDFVVSIVNPQKHERLLDPACGGQVFLISAWKPHASSARERQGIAPATSSRAKEPQPTR